MPRKKQTTQPDPKKFTPAPSTFLPVNPPVNVTPEHFPRFRADGIFELATIFSPLVWHAVRHIEDELEKRGDWLAAQAWTKFLDETCTHAHPCLRCLAFQLSAELPPPDSGDELYEPDPEDEAFWRDEIRIQFEPAEGEAKKTED